MKRAVITLTPTEINYIKELDLPSEITSKVERTDAHHPQLQLSKEEAEVIMDMLPAPGSDSLATLLRQDINRAFTK